MKSFFKYSLALAAVPLLSACIDDASDPDSGSTITQSQVSGVALDGPITGARVYADLNNNGRRDGFEPQARTDELGYFSYRPTLDGEAAINYCEQGPERHCLRVDNTSGEVRIRVEGGYDTVTGQAFRGSISGLVTIQLRDDTSVHVITPFTSSSLDAATDSGNFWSSKEDELDAKAAFEAYHKHQSLVDLADAIQSELYPDSSHSALVAALYEELAHYQPQSWVDLGKDEIQGVISDVIAGFQEDLWPYNESTPEDLAASFFDQRDAIIEAASAESSKVADFSREQLQGAVRSLRAFMNVQNENPTSISTEPLVWALGKINSNDCADPAPGRIRINKMTEQMGNDSGSRDFCTTMGSGSFPESSDKGDVTLSYEEDNKEPSELMLGFGSNGELSISGNALGDDFADEKISGTYSQPTEDQILISLEAFDGAFSDSASLSIVEANESESSFVYEFNFDGQTEVFELSENPFDQ